jgi:hypothetical protein
MSAQRKNVWQRWLLPVEESLSRATGNGPRTKDVDWLKRPAAYSYSTGF